MKNVNHGMRNRFSLAKLAILSLMALATTARPVFAREMAQGEFKLPTASRLGHTVLPAGEYTFSVETLGLIESFSSIRTSVAQPVVFVLHNKNGGGAFTSVFAFASSQKLHPVVADGLTLVADQATTAVSSLSLKEMGVVIDFNVDKSERPLRAPASVSGPSVDR